MIASKYKNCSVNHKKVTNSKKQVTIGYLCAIMFCKRSHYAIFTMVTGLITLTDRPQLQNRKEAQQHSYLCYVLYHTQLSLRKVFSPFRSSFLFIHAGEWMTCPTYSCRQRCLRQADATGSNIGFTQYAPMCVHTCIASHSMKGGNLNGPICSRALRRKSGSSRRSRSSRP